ncbi:MAG: hypothetical protein ACLFR1_10760, partial [Spirochaetia bacterium]
VPVRFQFLQGSGILTGHAESDEYGRAGTNVVSFDNPNQEQVILAQPVFQIGNQRFQVETASLEFRYTPPDRTTRIIAWVDLEGDTRSADMLQSFAAQALEGLGVDSISTGGPSGIAQTMSHQELLDELDQGIDERYVFIIKMQIQSLQQLEYEGRSFNIYQSTAVCHIHLIDMLSGETLYTSVTNSVRGQGGSRELALNNSIELAANLLQEHLIIDDRAIQRHYSQQ